MLVERSEILTREGSADAFAAVLRDRIAPLLAGIDGVHAVSVGRGVEHPDKFVLLVTWATMDAHITFTQTAAFGELRALFAPYSRGGAMEHFEMD